MRRCWSRIRMTLRLQPMEVEDFYVSFEKPCAIHLLFFSSNTLSLKGIQFIFVFHGKIQYG
jgi:hypothetical protein